MEYYKLEKRYTKGDIQIESFVTPQELYDKITKGLPCVGLYDELTVIFKNKTGKPVDFPIGGTTLPIVSGTFREFILGIEAEKNLEFYPLNLENIRSKGATYWLLNVIHSVSCFDWGKSIYTRFPERRVELSDRPETVDKLVIDEAKLKGRSIFRMKELPTDLFVSGNFKTFTEESGITGLRFTSIEEYEKW